MPHTHRVPPGGSLPSAQLPLHTLVWSRPARRPCCVQPQAPRSWSRYERLSFSMLGLTWGILVLAVAALHVGNYDLETKTSSTSGSHSGFYESARAIKSDLPPPLLQTPQGSPP